MAGEASPLGVVGKFVGNTVGEAAAFAAGIAIGPAIEPLLQALRNETWSHYPDKPLDAEQAAELVAQGLKDMAEGQAEAALTGYGASVFGLLVELAQIAPGTAETLNLWRRGYIAEADVDVALEKAKILPQYRPGIKELFVGRLDPAVIATAIQRGIMADPGFLPVGPPTEEGNVKAFPVSKLDAVAEAKAAGVDLDRLFVETAIVGNPASPEQAASGFFRGILKEQDYNRAIAEGNTRNEWAAALLEIARQIPTAHDFIEGQLRGWISEAERNAGVERHGMSTTDADLLFKVTGRPLSFHQAYIGFVRGGTYDGPITDIPDYFLAQLRQSNIRPEWYNLAWAQHETYPSYFVLRALLQAGTITEKEGETYFKGLGWPPDLAAKAAAAYATGGTAGTKKETAAELRAEYEGLFIDRATLISGLTALGYNEAHAEMEADLGDAARVKKARDEYVTVVQKTYLAHEITADQASSDLAQAGIVNEAIDNMVKFWTLSLGVARKQLTPAQIATGYKRQTIPLTTALQDLEDRGYTPADSQALLGLAAPVLTATQIQAAYKAGEITRDVAITQLTAEGYSNDQAVELVDTAVPPPAA